MVCEEDPQTLPVWNSVNSSPSQPITKSYNMLRDLRQEKGKRKKGGVGKEKDSDLLR